MKNKSLPPERLTEQDLSVKPPLALEWLGSEVKLKHGKRGDARIRLTRRGEGQTFLVEYKKLWTGASLKGAIEQIKMLVKHSPDDLPMVVLPYLSREMMETLMNEGVSGLDLVGNGYVDTPNWGMWLEGQPNTFKNTQVVKSPYQGKSALVARTLLACPVLPNAEALRAEIQRRGGAVSQPVVSRALKAFRDDLIVGSRGRYGLVLLQPEKLLDRLAEQWKRTVERWQAQGHTRLWAGRVEGEPTEFLPQLFRTPRLKGHEAVMTGLTSAFRHTHLTLEPVQYVYSNAVAGLLRDMQATETRRFPNLELRFPPDDAVFFDAVTDEQGIRWASVIQTYLETATGDSRMQETAADLRQALLEDLNELKTKLLQEGV